MKHVISQIAAGPLKVLIILCVFLTIILIAQVISTDLLQARIQLIYAVQMEEPEQESIQEKIQSSHIRWLPDGTVHYVFQKGAGMQETDSTEVEIYAPEDLRLLWTGSRSEIPYSYLEQADRFESRSDRGLDWIQNLDPDFSRNLVFPVADAEGRKTELWRYEFPDHHFTGYDLDKRIIGYCSAAGFTDSEEAVIPFEPLSNLSAWIPVTSRSPQALLLTAHWLYEVDFENRRLISLIEIPDSEIIRVEMVDWRQLAGTKKDSRPAILVHTQDRQSVLVLKDPYRTLPIQRPESMSGMHFRLHSSGDSFYLTTSWIKGAPDPYLDYQGYVKWAEENRYLEKTYCKELYRIEADGTLAFSNHFEFTPPHQPTAAGILQMEKLDVMRKQVSLFAPALFDWLYVAIQRHLNTRTELPARQTYLSDFTSFLSEIHPRGPWFYYPISLVLAAAALVHSLPRRTSWGRIIGWLVFIFCFNLAGFLTYLSLNHFPVIRCTSCGRHRGLNRPDCPACGAGLPSPEPRDVDLIYPPSGKPVSA